MAAAAGTPSAQRLPSPLLCQHVADNGRAARRRVSVLLSPGPAAFLMSSHRPSASVPCLLLLDGLHVPGDRVVHDGDAPDALADPEAGAQQNDWAGAVSRPFVSP